MEKVQKHFKKQNLDFEFNTYEQIQRKPNSSTGGGMRNPDVPPSGGFMTGVQKYNQDMQQKKKGLAGGERNQTVDSYFNQNSRNAANKNTSNPFFNGTQNQNGGGNGGGGYFNQNKGNGYGANNAGGGGNNWG